MEHIFHPLPSNYLPANVDYMRPPERRAHQITLDSPATETMTDFSSVFAETIGPDVPMDEANQLMIKRGIGLLLVIGATNHVIGLLSARDIIGEKPMQYIQEHGGRHEDICVRDIMTPHDSLPTITMATVAHARVGNIVTTLKMAASRNDLSI